MFQIIICDYALVEPLGALLSVAGLPIGDDTEAQ